MKRILIGALALLPLFLAGQPKWEFGLSAGGWMYMGDVAPTRLPVLRETQPGGGLLTEPGEEATEGIGEGFADGFVAEPSGEVGGEGEGGVVAAGGLGVKGAMGEGGEGCGEGGVEQVG